MCFVALLYQQVTDYPIVLAANRDERSDRPGLTPRSLRPGVWGGRDPLHGGTWLGVNAAGGIAAIANRRGADAKPGEAPPRSRGLLCLDVLEQADADGMHAALASALQRAPYQPFNLLFGDAGAMRGASWDSSRLTIEPLEPGIHLLGNRQLDDPDDPKLQRGRERIQPHDTLPPTLTMLTQTCADHGVRPDASDAICIHTGASPTLSCSVLAIHVHDRARSQYLHANARPCSSALLDYSSLLQSDGG